jgi:hypothetical protein
VATPIIVGAAQAVQEANEGTNALATGGTR